MFVIDEENSIAWYNKWVESDGPVKSAGFNSLRGLTKIAEARDWSKRSVTDIWNGFAGAAGFADLKPQKLFKNRPYGLGQIWKAIQRLVPTNAASEPVAPVVANEYEKAGFAEVAKRLSSEGVPKKKAKSEKQAKAKKVKSEVEAKPGSNLDQLVTMIGRKNGASIEEIMAKTGWSATHTVRGRISILKSKGVAIESFKHETRGRVYRTA